jgi:hypothetical protein
MPYGLLKLADVARNQELFCAEMENRINECQGRTVR